MSEERSFGQTPETGEAVRKPRRLRLRKSEKKAFRFHWRLTLLIVLLIAALLAVGYFLSMRNQSYTSRTVEFGLKNIGELATQAGYFTNVQTISDSREIFGITIPFTQKRYVYSYDGVVKAGVNFEQTSVTLDEASKVITVTLPRAEILSITVDEESFQVYDESKNIFNTLKIGDHNQAMLAMKQEITGKATANGILTNAESNAELLITGFLRGTFPEDTYTIEFHWIEKEAAQP